MVSVRAFNLRPFHLQTVISVTHCLHGHCSPLTWSDCQRLTVLISNLCRGTVALEFSACSAQTQHSSHSMVLIDKKPGSYGVALTECLCFILLVNQSLLTIDAECVYVCC